MRLDDLKHGTFVVLTATVPNPSADGRVKNDWTRVSSIREGSTFLVDAEPGVRVQLGLTGRNWHQRIASGMPLFEALLPYLREQAEEELTAHQLLTRALLESNGADVLQKLLDEGCVTRKAIVRACALLNEEA